MTTGEEWMREQYRGVGVELPDDAPFTLLLHQSTGRVTIDLRPTHDFLKNEGLYDGPLPADTHTMEGDQPEEFIEAYLRASEGVDRAVAQIVAWYWETPPTESRPDRRARKPLTRVPQTIRQQTAPEFRSAAAALSDSPILRRFENVEGDVALRHIVDGWDLQTVISGGSALQWWGRPLTCEALREEVRQLGLDGVSLLYILADLSLAQDKVEISLDELLGVQQRFLHFWAIRHSCSYP
jgi:hypothetical protein